MKRIHTVRLVVLSSFIAANGPAAGPVPIALGRSLAPITGPWKFHIGDNAEWANPNFDDSAWETVDLSAPAGAHDDDVGLTNYVPGWEARGHRGYSGYAWYRARVAISAPPGEALALAGPPAVDSAYQIFVDGASLGQLGRFSGATPTVYSIQPRVFPIPGAIGKSTLVAFRVWMGPWNLADNAAGGIHIAPVVGEASAIDMLCKMQWLQTVRGYVVEVVEAIAFVLLAIMACNFTGTTYIWLTAALILTALFRANQAAFFWGQFETVQDFELISVVLLIPLCLGAWSFTWLSWFQPPGLHRARIIVTALTLLYILLSFLSGSWFHTGLHWRQTISLVRILFLLLMVLIVYRGIRRQENSAWYLLPAVLLISVGQFAQELSFLGIRGIWFPFGTGVSRTQFSYAAFDVLLFVVLARRPTYRKLPSL